MIEDDSDGPCPCEKDTSSTQSPISPHCTCPRDPYGIVLHNEDCLMYKNETIIYPHVPDGCECQSPRFKDGVCMCCACPEDQCFCRRAGKEAFDEWRNGRKSLGALPAVLETTHPLLQRFQETLKKFLLKENAIAEEEILNLKDELKLSKSGYERDLEGIYRSDHDTNAQRVLIEEYERSLAQRSEDRQEAEKRARDASDRYNKVQEKLNQDIMAEREATQELEALTSLCRQLEKWREETESGLTISHRMSDKMRAEKQALADEKRELDMMIFGLSNEVWKLESKLEMFKKQMEIKNNEMDNINDKVTAYAAELEDLDLDKRRLMALWNSVLINIQQRDRVYDSVRDDYKALQENYRTLLNNLDITKKVVMDEMNRGKEKIMNRDKLIYDNEHINKQFDAEDQRRVALEAQIDELTQSIEMADRDQELIQMENQTMNNILKSTCNEFDRKTEDKIKLENEILANMQDCLLNDKAVQSMASGIKKMREMSRQQELGLIQMENQHAKMMLDIEVRRSKQAKNNLILEENLNKVRTKEKKLEQLQEKYDLKVLIITRKQRELDIVLKKYIALKEIFDHKSPQERRIEELEVQIKDMRERTESMQHEWLRLQGHVVKLTEQHHKMQAEIHLTTKQIQICEQKTMRFQAECENIEMERNHVDRNMRELRGKLEVLARTRKDSVERNEMAHKANLALTHEYSANLKGAEMEILELEEEIDQMEKEKVNLTQELDRVQREALIWQRKGILAVELKRNMKEAKSAAGEIGQMKNEIHRMEVRREQLRKTGEKLAEDLALYVTRRDTAMEKTRANAAVEKAHGGTNTSQSSYHHKLRLAKADVARVTKELSEAEARLKYLRAEQERLDGEVSAARALGDRLEERVAGLIRACADTDMHKQWLLERVVRSQRLGKELATAIKRQSVRVRKPKEVVHDEYNEAVKLNNKLRYIVDCLLKEYPQHSDRLAVIANTLNIRSPTSTPRECGPDCRPECLCDGHPPVPNARAPPSLVSDCPCEQDENVAEKPFAP